MILLFWACAPDDACDAMCDAGLGRFEACLDADGLAWGEAVGYDDARDYTNWCETWVWETRLLGQEASCAEKLPIFEDGDCDAYDAAWAE